MIGSMETCQAAGMIARGAIVLCDLEGDLVRSRTWGSALIRWVVRTGLQSVELARETRCTQGNPMSDK